MSIFLEALKTARSLVPCKECAIALDNLIKEHESGEIETTSINPKVETR
jgi:hypothetical protein